MTNDTGLSVEYFYDIIQKAYYDGCIKALDDIGQDVSQESDEYLKSEAEDYAKHKIEELFGHYLTFGEIQL